MTPRLAQVLSARDLPEAELCASRLDGELYRLGAAFCPIDEIDNRVRRAQSLAARVPDRLIAEQRTVAWVFGLSSTPPHPLQLCSRASARLGSGLSADLTVREVIIDDDELWTLGGLTMTSPLRTAIDLARHSATFADEDIGLVRALAVDGQFSLSDCIESMSRRKNLPRKRRASERLASSLR